MLAGGLGVAVVRGDGSGAASGTETTTTTRPLSADAKSHELAFLSTGADGTTVFLTDGVGSEISPLATLGGRAERLLWSPDGTRLLLDGDAAGDFELQVVDAGTGAVTALAASPSSSEGGASWSPDGTQVAFFSDREGRFAGYVVDVAGGAPRRVTPADLPAVTDLAWSPDGTQLAFSTSENADSAVWVVGTDGAGARQVGELPGSTQAAWSPDGKSLAVSAQPVGEPSADIYLLDVASGEGERLAGTEYRDAFPVWAPDGESLYFVAATPNDDAEGGAADDIFRVPLAGGDPVEVTSDPISVESELTFTADGELIALSVTRGGNKEIFVANRDGSGAIPLSRSERLDAFAAWRPGTGPD